MNLESIQTKALALNQTLKTIEDGRALWQSEKKQLLIDTLKELSKISGLGLRVKQAPFRTNQEAIIIYFPNRPSGIIETIGKESKHLVKNGGQLIFSQAYNGEVFVFINYPFIEDVISTSDDHYEGRFSMQNINEAFIGEMFEKFLDLMILWEQSNGKNKIGFKS